MPTSISIIGASGAVGSTLAGQILRSTALNAGDRLQLVGHGTPSNAASLLSLRIDLMDGFDDRGVEIEVVADMEDVDGDIVVMCAGRTLNDRTLDRRGLGMANLELFENAAAICKERVPESLFLIVSNPVELAVKIFSEKLGRNRVFGMGAQQDSLRFARAIAHDLGVSRDHVAASVLGEHGQAMTPLWSSVHLTSRHPEVQEQLDVMLAKSAAAAPLAERVLALQAKVMELLANEETGEAYEASRRALPDARIFVQPLITCHTLHSTPYATSNTTLQLILALLSDTATPHHGQVMLRGEFLGIEGICGVPISVSSTGWKAMEKDSLTLKEQQEVLAAAASIARYLASIQPAGIESAKA